MKTIFKSENGEVYKDGEKYITLSAGHRLCCDLAREIERLREAVAKCERLIAAIESPTWRKFQICHIPKWPEFYAAKQAMKSAGGGNNG